MSKQISKQISKQLAKCPFCGGEAEWVTEIKCYGHGDFRKVITVMCLTCCADTHIEKEEKDALELWNTRKPIERVIEKLEEEIAENPDASLGNYRAGLYKAIEIIKEGMG